MEGRREGVLILQQQLQSSLCRNKDINIKKKRLSWITARHERRKQDGHCSACCHDNYTINSCSKHTLHKMWFIGQ